MRFSDLNLRPPLLQAVEEEGYTEPTPIQAQAIPPVLLGRDLLGIAQTGTGKTAAFALPILDLLSGRPPPTGLGFRPIRALVLTPTRELAAQIGQSLATYGRHLALRHTVVFGGVGQRPQVDALRRGVDVLVATPGRLLDLLGQRWLTLSTVEVFVLDEADRMLDMGFLPAVRRVLEALPRRRQTLFFSATMGREPQGLADQILTDPVRVEVTPQATTAERVAQSVYFVEKHFKQALLEHLLKDPAITRALVFTRTKHGADKVVRRLYASGLDAAAIHANKSQGQRERALHAFQGGRTRVLVATDIASRGIDVEQISHVINYDLPNLPEAYVHRIGRTARAGASGRAISFCDSSERPYLKDIEKEIRARVPVVADHPFAGKHRPPAEPGFAPHPQDRPPHGRPHHGRPQHERPRRDRFHETGRFGERPARPASGARPSQQGPPAAPRGFGFQANAPLRGPRRSRRGSGPRRG
jgi:ATP-dependent RNA helicase RhlE